MKRIYNINSLAIGDWIIVKTRDDRTYYCYITEINNSNSKFRCFITKYINYNGKEIQLDSDEKYLTLNTDSGSYKIYLDSSIIIEEKDKPLLIDLALQTKDEQWFKELVG